MTKKYKAIMLDIDGTLIPYDYEALPSQKVIYAINSIKKDIHVSLVTGRSIKSTRRIIKALGLDSGYAVVDGGAYIYNIDKKQVIYEKFILQKDMHHIVNVLLKYGVDFYVKDEDSRKGPDRNYKSFHKGDSIKNVTMIFTNEVFSLEQTHKIMRELATPNITIFRTHHKTPDLYALNITHTQATKMHGVAIVAEKLNVKREEIIGVGDSYNDFPLLMASGLKVAMGNAIDDLKEIADYVAPSVEDDGVYEVIKKFVKL